MTTRGKTKGRILFHVDTGHGYEVAKVHEWIVTSVMRPPRRHKWYRVQPKRVYLKTGDGVDSLGRRDSFDLDEWPGKYSATKPAAWKRSINRIGQEIKRVERYKAEALDEGDLEWAIELRKEGALLKRSLTKARKLAKKV